MNRQEAEGLYARVRTHQTAHGVWFCTLFGRYVHDAPYWHGTGPTEDAAITDAAAMSHKGFDDEGYYVAPHPHTSYRDVLARADDVAATVVEDLIAHFERLNLPVSAEDIMLWAEARGINTPSIARWHAEGRGLVAHQAAAEARARARRTPTTH
jgi:hypothetical protein